MSFEKKQLRRNVEWAGKGVAGNLNEAAPGKFVPQGWGSWGTSGVLKAGKCRIRKGCGVILLLSLLLWDRAALEKGPNSLEKTWNIIFNILRMDLLPWTFLMDWNKQKLQVQQWNPLAPTPLKLFTSLLSRFWRVFMSFSTLSAAQGNRGGSIKPTYWLYSSFILV